MTTVETPKGHVGSDEQHPTAGAVVADGIDVHRDRHPFLGLPDRPDRHLDRLPHPAPAGFPDGPEPVEPLGSEHLHRHHGNRDRPTSSCTRRSSTCRSTHAARLPGGLTGWALARRPTGSSSSSASTSSTACRARRSSRRSSRSPRHRAGGHGGLQVAGGLRRTAFIVTLGGFLVWRGLIFRPRGQASRAPAPLHPTFQLLVAQRARSATGGAGWSRCSPAAGIVLSLVLAQQRRQRHDLGVRPMSAEIGLGVLGCAAVIASVGLVANRYDSPSPTSPRASPTRSSS